MQQRLLNWRTGKAAAVSWSPLFFIGVLLFTAMGQVIYAFLIDVASTAGERVVRAPHNGVAGLPQAGTTAALVASIILIVWAMAMTFQGEGLELDVQRRRQPIWEWLFSHPVMPAAVFTAEMLTPIASNAAYLTIPVFFGVLYSFVYGPSFGVAAAILCGVPVMFALACLGRALHIVVLLRVGPRSRGAILGVMSWIGWVCLMGIPFFSTVFFNGNAVERVTGLLQPLAHLPWPWIGFALGEHGNGFVFLDGVLFCAGISIAVMAASVGFSVLAIRNGLEAPSGRTRAKATQQLSEGYLTRDPLYRKELLWLRRDRGAIVQALLIPISLAAFQILNIRNAMHFVVSGWSYICTAGIVFGTYFLWMIGPRSLASEGPALWISLTWPRGLEDLLRAKSRLWSFLASALVMIVLLYALVTYPHDAWKVAFVATGWLFFSRTMAAKSVTLVTAPSSSGAVNPAPRGRQWAAALGMLTFAIGVATQQWNLVVVGIVYSMITAAAMWQNFRESLPFLYDPWSEKLPPAPTLMHAIIAIAVLIEAGAIVFAFVLGFVPTSRAHTPIVQTMAYTVCAAVTVFCVNLFLEGRGVGWSDVWRWRSTPNGKLAALFPAVVAGAAVGLGLAVFAHGYMWAAAHIPSIGPLIQRSQALLARDHELKIAYASMAILVAPVAEEYLFRGLLFRALDREWGGWRAILGSAAFFAIYHPVLAWVPVFLLGVANAVIFKRTGRLGAAVALHAVYNAGVLLV